MREGDARGKVKDMSLSASASASASLPAFEFLTHHIMLVYIVAELLQVRGQLVELVDIRSDLHW